MRRAKQMGFDKDVFHATDKAFDQFDSTLQELGTHVGTVRQAEDVIRAGKSLGDKNPEKFVQGAQVMPLKIKGKYVGVPDMRDFSDPFLYMQTRRRPKLPFNAPAAFLKELDDAAKAIGESRLWDQTNRAQSRKPWGEEVRRIAKKHGIDGFRYLNEFEGTPNVSYVVFDPSNIRSVNAAFDPDKAASPILTAGAGGGRKPPKPDSPEAIRESVRKVSESIRAKGINAKPQPSEMRVGKGMSKLTGIKDDPAMSMNVASDMLKAGRSPDEIWTATQRLPIKIEGRTILVRGAGKTPEDVQAGFWQEMAKPYSKRASWAQKGTEGIFPMGSGSIARQPLDDRLNAVAKRLSTNRERIPRRDIWEETGVVVITRGQDGQMVTGKAYITNGFEPVALMDAKQFKTFDEAQAYLDSIPAMPRADQPDWYRKNFSQVLDAGSLRRLGKGEVAARRVGEQVLKHPRVVGFAAGSAIGASGVIVTDAELKRRQAATRQPTSTTKMLPTPAAQNNRANISR
jgi:hypothetical protein